MSLIREFALRARGFFTRAARRDEGVRDELRFHQEMLEGDLRRQGMSAAHARREARIRLGGPVQIVEAYSDQRSLPVLETLLQDARYACRTWARTPAFTFAALVTLALGIGANAAIFTLAHTLLMRPLPYADPGRLVAFGDAEANGLPSNIGFQTFADIRDQNKGFEAVAAIRSWSPTLVTTEAEQLNAMRVSWNFFALLGIRPAIGRDFASNDDRPDRWRVLILSDGLWRRRFAADPAVIGRSIRMNDQTYQIVGVMPPTFEPLLSAFFYKPAELWAPLGYDAPLPYACRSCQHLKAIGRVRNGVTLGQATADLDRVRAGLVRAFPREYPVGRMTAMPLHQLIARPVRGGLLVLLAAVGCVLLIACANVANLLLARSISRTREMALRAALGAGRRRLMRQMLTESAVLGVAGGVLGLAVAALLLPLVISLAPVNVPRLDAVSINRVVLAFGAGLSIATGLIFGLIPAFRASSAQLREALISDTRGAVGSGSQRGRQALVVADLTMALVLLTGAGLMVKSLVRVMNVDPGFQASRVLTLQFSLVGEAYREDSAVMVFINQAIEKVQALPGVEAAALAGQIPMGGNGDSFGFHVDGLMHANPADDPSAERYSVTPDYFRVMSIPLKRGRLFTVADTASSAPVMVVSESTERQLFEGRDPIGRRVRVGDGARGPWRTIVGIVGDVHHADLTAAATPQMYLPQAQFTDSFLVMTIKSSTSEPQAHVPAVREALRELDASVPVYQVATLEDLLSRSFAQRRFVMMLLGGFAALALVLACVGLYGIVSYTVTQRAREVGVRIALGATASDIVGLIARAGAGTVAVGLIVGLAFALVLTRFLRSLLFDVSPVDPQTFATAVLILTAIAAAAHWVPLRRALKIDPAVALRQD